jgi:hypothetical protein
VDGFIRNANIDVLNFEKNFCFDEWLCAVNINSPNFDGGKMDFPFNKIASILLLCLLITSCSAQPSSVLRKETCVRPCWHNITPGRTSKPEVLAMMPTIPEVDSDSIKHYESDSNDYIQWNFKSRTGDNYGVINFTNNIVSLIEIYPNKNFLQVQDAIQRLGVPEKVLATYKVTEVTWLNIFLISPTNGYVLLMVNPKNEDTIQSDDTVTGVFYLAPKSFDSALITNKSIGIICKELLKGMKPWIGYGKVTYIEGYCKR